jgi:hypothetical protein
MRPSGPSGRHLTHNGKIGVPVPWGGASSRREVPHTLPSPLVRQSEFASARTGRPLAYTPRTETARTATIECSKTVSTSTNAVPQSHSNRHRADFKYGSAAYRDQRKQVADPLLSTIRISPGAETSLTIHCPYWSTGRCRTSRCRERSSLSRVRDI